jgi:GT2 family glycosyltransferase
MKEQPVILSIVIVNWNTRELLFKCLESVYEFAPTCTFEVLLVDNASSDGSAALVSNLFPQVRLFAIRRIADLPW